VLKKWQQDKLNAWIKEKTRRAPAILRLTDEEGLSQRGIADRLGLSKTTVNGILKRREVSAVAALRGMR
jgi:DNA-binding transcriptional regulator LsrR (DeoR family)